MTYLLEITVKMKDGSEWNDFYQVNADTREEAVEMQKSNLLSRIQKAEDGNRIWASNSADYANWVDFLLV